MRLALALLSAVSLLSLSTAQKDPHFFRASSSPYSEFAFAVAAIGDHNGDGHDDLLVSSPSSFASFPGRGHVQVLSGEDGRPLMTFTDLDERWNFGWSVLGLDDVDGDGVLDFAVSSLRSSALQSLRSSVGVYSGATGARLWMFAEPVPGDQLGRDMDVLGDQNGDGIRDLVVGAPLASSNAPYAGSVLVLSGVDGSLLRRIDGSIDSERLGMTVSRIGDVDMDGFEDFLAGAPGADGVAGPGGGQIRTYSGATGGVIRITRGRAVSFAVGSHCDDVGDVDGDGVDDFLMNTGFGNPFVAFNRITVVSGGTGELLMSVRTPSGSTVGLSRQAEGIGDANGDGRPDIAYGVQSYSGGKVISRIQVADALTGDLIFQSIELAEMLGTVPSILARAGDLDGDGLDDVALAVPRYSVHAPQSGALVTFSWTP